MVDFECFQNLIHHKQVNSFLLVFAFLVRLVEVDVINGFLFQNLTIFLNKIFF